MNAWMLLQWDLPLPPTTEALFWMIRRHIPSAPWLNIVPPYQSWNCSWTTRTLIQQDIYHLLFLVQVRRSRRYLMHSSQLYSQLLSHQSFHLLRQRSFHIFRRSQSTRACCHRSSGSMGTANMRACFITRHTPSCSVTSCTRRRCTCSRRAGSSIIDLISRTVSGSASSSKMSRRSAPSWQSSRGGTGPTSRYPQ